VPQGGGTSGLQAGFQPSALAGVPPKISVTTNTVRTNASLAAAEDVMRRKPKDAVRPMGITYG
jgi:hypothetical protein